MNNIPLQEELSELRKRMSRLEASDARRKRAECIQQILYHISNAVHTTSDFDELFEVIQTELGKIIDTTNFFIALYDKETQTLSLPYQKDEKDQFSSIPSQKTLTGYVIKTGKPLLADRKAIEKLRQDGEIDIVGTSCEVWLGAPLMMDGTIIGVVALQSYTDTRAYTREDLEILNFVSEQIGISIHRKSAEKNLLSLTAMIEQSTDSIIQMDTDSRISYLNEAAQKMLGWSLEEIKGKNPRILGADRDAQEALTEAGIRLAAGESYSGEGLSVRKDGTTFYCRFKTTPLFDRNKKIYGYMGIMQDVTPHKQAEAHRQKLEEQLIQAQKMEAIGNLAGGIAHDFNNILGVIIGYTQLAIDETTEEGSHLSNLRKVMKAAERAKEVVKQILTFSRKSETEHKPIQLDSILKDALSLLRASIPSTIEIRQKIGKYLNPVMANPIQMHQVIMNICTNAAQAMKEKGGLIDIVLSEMVMEPSDVVDNELAPGIYQQLVVSDTGPGMTPEVSKRIFEPYFTTKAKDEGTGMGLAVVHGIVKSHDGDIIVNSEPGAGSSFYVFLPVTKKKKESRLKLPEAIPRGREQILFIDDEPVLVHMGQMMLEKLGYKVDIHTGSLEALKSFQARPNKYDLVITDQTMPDMTGLQLAVEMKKLRPSLPIVICTGFSENIDEDNYKAKGIDGFILKPIIKQKIARVIRDLLDRRQQNY